MDLGCETCGVKRCLADCDMGRGFGVLGFRCVGGWVEGRWVGGWWRCKKGGGGGVNGVWGYIYIQIGFGD